MTNTHAPQFGVFDIIGKSVRLYLANVVVLFLYAFVPLVIFGMLSLALVDNALFDPQNPVTDLSLIFTTGMLFLMIASSIVSTLIFAVVVMLSYDNAVGDHSGLSQYISHGLRNVFPLVVLSIAFMFMFFLSFMFFVLPSLVVIAFFLVYFQTVLIDGAGWKGLNASAELTKGYRWPVLGAALVAFLIMIVPFVVISVFTGFGGLTGLGIVPSTIVSSVLNALMYGFGATFGTQVYLRLTELKRGGSGRDLSDVFS